MATIEKRGPYQWRAKIRRRGYPSETRAFETKAAAERWSRQIETEMDNNTFVSRSESENTTLKELLKRYLEEVTPNKKGADTEAYRIKALLRHPLATRIVATIRGTDIAAYRDERLKKVSPGTVKRELVLLGHLFETARKEWAIHMENPVRLIRPPADSKRRDRWFRGNEEQHLWNDCRAAKNRHLVTIVRLALETAMRQGELINLRWEHVDLDRRIAHLPDTKNGEARTVPLSSAAIEALKALPQETSGQVLAGITKEAVKQAFTRATKRAGIDNFHFHDLRHEATSRLFERGLNIMEVSAITGHKNLSMLKRYTHLKAEDLARKLG